MRSTSWLLHEMDDRERADAIARVLTHESEKLAAEFGFDRERLRTILERGLTARAGEPLREAWLMLLARAFQQCHSISPTPKLLQTSAGTEMGPALHIPRCVRGPDPRLPGEL